jgi:hypothetical protein
MNPNCPWLLLTPKVLQLCINHFVSVLCKSMWIIEAYQFFLVPSQSSSTALYPFKVLRAKEHASTLYSSVVFNLGLTFESLKELGVHHNYCYNPIPNSNIRTKSSTKSNNHTCKFARANALHFLPFKHPSKTSKYSQTTRGWEDNLVST